MPSSVLWSGNVMINRLNSSPEETCILCPRAMLTTPLTCSFRVPNSLMMSGQRRRLGSSLQSTCCNQTSWAPEPQASSPDLGTATVMTVWEWLSIHVTLGEFWNTINRSTLPILWIIDSLNQKLIIQKITDQFIQKAAMNGMI